MNLTLDDTYIRDLIRTEIDAARSARYVSRKRIADLHGVSERLVRTWRERGLPGVKVGGTIMFDVTETDRWLDSHR